MTKRLFTLMVSILFLQGCVTDLPPALFMPRTVDASPRPLTQGSLTTVTVTAAPTGVGQHITPASFQIALTETLKRADLFGDDQSKPYRLSCHLTHGAFPGAGLTMTSVLDADYELTDARGDIVFAGPISSTASATVGEEFLGSARSLLAFQRANEGHFRQLIEKLRAALNKREAPPPLGS